ncbi:transposase [Peptoniphilus porci]|uniref:transposase n=1 Tax=Peptoniphilus porci TaxID=2652280 RepID=UPI0009FB35F6
MKNTLNTNYNNGKVEGINNKIKVIKRISYGYRSFDNFRLRIFYVFTIKKYMV